MVSFNVKTDSGYPPERPEYKTLAQSIWGKEIEVVVNKRNYKFPFPVYILISSFEDAGVQYSFSIINTTQSTVECIPPGNGAGIVDMYSTCPLRVTATEKATGRSVSQQFEDYCFLFSNNKSSPTSQNHTEILFDRHKGEASFRVIQHGKQVPECNKTIKYKASHS